MLRQHRHTKLPGFGQLAAGFGARHHEVRLAADRGSRLTAAFFDLRRSLVPAQHRQGPRQHEGLAGKNLRWQIVGLFFFHENAGLSQLVDQRQMFRIGEIADHAFGDARSDIGDLDQLLQRGFRDCFHFAISFRQNSGHFRPDKPDAQRKQQPRQSRLPTCVDGLHQVGGGFFPQPLLFRQVIDLQGIQVGGVTDQSRVQKRFNDRRAHAVDIHRIPRYEMNQAFPGHRRTGGVHAPVRRFTRFAYDRPAAFRTGRRHDELPLRSHALLRHDGDHFRDHFARLVDDDRIADPHVLVADEVFIMQGRPAHGRPGQQHRLQDGGRCQHAGPPYADENILDDRRGLFGRKLPGNGPTRFLHGIAQFLLQRQRIDLDDQAVDIVVQSCPPVGPAFTMRDDLLNG